MGKRMNLEGMKFGRLTVLEFESVRNKNSYFHCVCECGKRIVAAGNSLKTGNTKSCGCSKGELISQTHKKHGHASNHSTSPEYRAWNHMIARCENQNIYNYCDYGGRGIKVCERWRHSFENFLEDMGERPTSSHSLDRIDVNGNYEPSNCRWADSMLQAFNKRLPKNNTTGVKGVYWVKRKRKFSAEISYRKKHVHLGLFDTKEDATKARREAEIRYWGFALND